MPVPVSHIFPDINIFYNFPGFHELIGTFRTFDVVYSNFLPKNQPKDMLWSTLQ